MNCMICGQDTGRKFALYCDRGCRTGLGVRKPLKKMEYIVDDNDKWVKIGINSSTESLRELAGLKNTMPPQAIRFQDLIKPRLIMSNFE